MQLALSKPSLPAMSDEAINRVRALEAQMRTGPQVPIRTQHLIHAGMYHRTIMIPAMTALTGALMKRATTLVVSGDCFVHVGDETLPLQGYNVLPGSAGRKQAFVAITDTWLTMVFPTRARTVEEAEREFTDEHELLMSHVCENDVQITEET